MKYVRVSGHRCVSATQVYMCVCFAGVCVCVCVNSRVDKIESINCGIDNQPVYTTRRVRGVVCSLLQSGRITSTTDSGSTLR
jgi:hypothetical protein